MCSHSSGGVKSLRWLERCEARQATYFRTNSSSDGSPAALSSSFGMPNPVTGLFGMWGKW